MNIGAQLYTLRTYTQTERDFGRTLERVAELGYEYVQLSAQGPIPPKRLRALCDANGLKIALTHNPESSLLYDTDALIEAHALYGCKYVGLGYLPERYQSEHWLPRFAEDFRAPAEKLRAAGMLLMYHHHALEFAHLSDGGTMMDRLLAWFPEDLMGVTADTYWLQFAGLDVTAWLAAHANRLRCVHLKDCVPRGFEMRMAALGRGNMDFPGILAALEQGGATEYALVEQDECYGESPFDCLGQSRGHLRMLGY